MSDNCPDRDRLTAYLAGTLPAAERPGIDAHLESCPTCGETLGTLSGVGMADLLAMREPVAPLSPFLQALAASPPEPPPAAPLSFPDPPTDRGPLGRLGPYHVARLVGRGAFGVVYEAYDESLGQTVALKVLRPERAEDARDRARFEREGRQIAAVRHPNVVTVYSVGQTPGYPPYLVMEYVGGGSLDARVRSAGRLEPRAAASLVAKVARGVAAAHDQGIVHRDLKPANVLLDGAGEPKVADFGLARRQADATATQVLAGTPAYMAPEQARGARFVGPPADVWALGVMLYECVTGARPFDAGSTAETIQCVLSEEPPKIRAEVPGAPHDLETIVEKCLVKEPEGRYATAGELASDLERFGRGEPIAARPTSRAERAVRWARRKPVAAAALALTCAVVLLAAFGTVTTLLWRQAESNREVAAAARNQLAEENERTEHARRRLAAALLGEADARRTTQQALDETSAANEQLALTGYGLRLQHARQAHRDGDLGRARDLLALCPPRFGGWERQYVERLCYPSARTLAAQAVAVARFGPTDAEVLTCGYPVDLGPPVAQVRSLATGAELFKLEVRAGASVHLASGPEGKRVAFLTAEGIAVWNTDTGKATPLIKLEQTPLVGSLMGITFDRTGARLLAVDDLGTVTYWDAVTGKEVGTPRAFSPKTGRVVDVCFTPDGSRAVASLGDGDGISRTTKEVQVWNLTGDEKPVTLNLKLRIGWIGVAGSVAVSADGSRVATVGPDHAVYLWDAATGRELASHKWNANCVALSPDGTRVLTGHLDGRVVLHDTTSGAEVYSGLGHEGNVGSVAFSPDGRRALSATPVDIRFWELNSPPDEVIFKLPPRTRVGLPVVDPAGKRLVVETDADIRLYNATTGRELVNVSWASRPAPEFVFSPDGGRLAILRRGRFMIGGEVVPAPDWSVVVCDSKTGRNVVRIGHDRPRPPRKDRDELPIVPPPGAGNPAPEANPPVLEDDGPVVGPVLGMAFSDDGTRLTTLAAPSRAPGQITNRPGVDTNHWVVDVWDTATGARLHTRSLDKRVDGDAADLNTFAVFSGEGHVAIVRQGKEVKEDDWARGLHTPGRVEIWATATGGRTATLDAPDPFGEVATAAFSPNGAHLVTVDKSRPARFDEEKLRPVPLRVDIGELEESPWRVRLWDARSGKLIVQVAGREAAFSPNGERLAVAKRDKIAAVYSTATGKELLQLRGHTGAVESIAYHPDGSRIVTGSTDGTAKLWDAEAGVEVFTLRQGAVVSMVGFSGGGTKLVTGDALTVRVWAAQAIDPRFTKVAPVPRAAGPRR